jgi:hypothetical protein
MFQSPAQGSSRRAPITAYYQPSTNSATGITRLVPYTAATRGTRPQPITHKTGFRRHQDGKPVLPRVHTDPDPKAIGCHPLLFVRPLAPTARR